MASGGGKPLFATGVAALLGGLAVSRGGSRSLCRPETARLAVLLSATVAARPLADYFGPTQPRLPVFEEFCHET